MFQKSFYRKVGIYIYIYIRRYTYIYIYRYRYRYTYICICIYITQLYAHDYIDANLPTYLAVIYQFLL